MKKRYIPTVTAAALLVGSLAGLQARAHSFGINFIGNTGDTVTNSAGVVPITNWNNISAATFTSGSIQSSDKTLSATLALSGAAAAGSWHSGATSDGGNGSLQNGYIDGGSSNGGGTAITNKISGLTEGPYTVYLYIYGDASHPADGGQWLPSYSINGTPYFAPSLGKATSTWDSTSTTVGGTFNGFIRASTFSTNFNSASAAPSNFGNYIEIDNVSPVTGVIEIVSEASSQSWRSPLDGIEIVGTANLPVTSAPLISPTNNPVYAGTPVSLSELATGQNPLFYQWRTDGGTGGARTNIPGEHATNLLAATDGWAPGAYHYDVIVSNSVGVSTSTVATLNLVNASLPIALSPITPNPATSYVGGSVTFSATFGGTLPIFYQWQMNTGNGPVTIPGATNPAITLANIQLTNAGDYTLLASNALGGPVASDTAHLTVLPLPSHVNAITLANPVGYWRLNETNSTAGGNLIAADMIGNHSGIYGAGVTDGVSGPSPVSGFAGLEPNNTAAQFTGGAANSFITLPALNLNTNTVTITAWIYPLSVPGANSGLFFCRPNGDASGFNFSTGGQLGYTWNQNNGNTYSWASGLVPPVQQWSLVALVTSPQNAIIYLCNTNGVLSATNPVPSTVEAFNATTLIGADPLGGRVFNGLMDEVAVFNTSLSQPQVAQLFYSAASSSLTLSPPAIFPANNVFSGTTVTLTENAFGLAPLQYQWRMNGIAIPGATNSILILTNTTVAASGNYSVLVSNSSVTNSSSTVMLTVNPPSAPVFAQEPTPVTTTNYAGGFATFTASVNGTPPISLQWQHDGVNIPNANSSTLVLGDLQTTTSGNYTLSASNSFGATNSLPANLVVLPLPGSSKPNVATYHYDNTRQGQNTNELLLTLANVNPVTFGKLFTYPVDGYVYAQPLIIDGINIPGRGVRKVVFVTTMHDSVYAFDADSNGDSQGGLLWHTNLGISSPSPITEYGTRYHTVGNLDVVPEEGMTGTPVIDTNSGTLYLDAFTREVMPGVSTNYFHRIHALNITNGTEQSYSPVEVKASVPGTGVSGNNYTETNGTTVAFSAVQHCQRPALTLAGGMLYVCYGSHDDTDPYHGWVMGYNSTNLALVSVFNTTPNATTAAFGSHAGEGAIWMSGNGLCVDDATNLYCLTGNGSFSQNTNGGDYSDSFLKLSTVSNKLAAADYFTPYNQASLQSSDADLGSGGALLLPDSAGSATHPHLIVGAGKEGKIYLVDRDNMGHFNAANDSQIVQSVGNAVGGCWCSPAYWNNYIYFQGNGDVVKAFRITNGVIASTPVSKSGATFGFPGATPTISANGTNNGILWIIQADAYLSSGPAILHAYNATNLAQELYNSSQNLARDNPGGGVKMVPPVVTGGKVYVGAEYALSVFGNAIFVSPPTIFPNGNSFIDSTTVTLANTTAGSVIYYTLDGSTPSTNSTIYTGPFVLTNSALVQAIASAPGAVASSVASASFINSAAVGTGIGLQAQYWSNTTSVAFTNAFFNSSSTLTRTDAVVNFNWNTTGPDPSVGQTTFTARWTGSVQPQFDGTYTFYAASDDGVRLWVNGQLLVDDWKPQGLTTNQGSIPLKAQQFYNIRMDYYQGAGSAGAILAWSNPSTPQTVIPQTQLYPYTNPPPTVLLTAPSGNATNFTASASATITADADSPYNPINFVSFYGNGMFLGSVSNAPYTLTATGLTAGNYTLTAVAVDGSGLSSTSAPVQINVKAGSGQPYGLSTNDIAPPFFNMPTTFTGSLPPLLSQTGVFGDTSDMLPTNGLIPYIPNVSLWSDGAVKTRYLALPTRGGPLTPDQQITFAATNSWTFPAGTIFVKTFQLNTDTRNPNVLHRLETRLLVRDINGAVYGVTYKWRADNSDADLLPGNLSENIVITNATGMSTQTWYYPSPSDCLQCHTRVANYVLGLSTRQLNGNETYPSTGVTDNQLRTLNRLGRLNPAIDEATIVNLEKLSALTNTTASLEERARSYLDANCVQCHQPGGTGITFDSRYSTPLANQNLTNYPAAVSLGYDNTKVIAAKDVWRSVIWQRMNTTNDTYKMPPLARALIDTNAVQVFADWINSLPGTPALAPPTLTPNGGNFAVSVKVAAQQADPNAAIYYTLDGSLPSTNSWLYSGPFQLLSNTTVSASTFRTGYVNSVASKALFLVAPLHFTTQGFTNNLFQMVIAGAPGSNYVLQASTNLYDWSSINTNTAPDSLFNLIDPNATNYRYRFYRIQQQ